MKTDLIVFGLLTLIVSGCTQSVDVTVEQIALLQLDREWSQVAAGEDLEQLLSHWAEDAVIYPPGRPAVVGKEAIREFIEQSRAVPGFAISWEPKEAVVSQGGDMAYTLGITRITVNDSEGKPIVNLGKYTVVWRKQGDGSWKCVVDMFNFDRPPIQPNSPPVE